MQFNQFAWSNYKQTKNGQHVIQVFEEGSVDNMLALFDRKSDHEPSIELALNSNEVIQWVEDLQNFCIKPVLPNCDEITLEQLQHLFEDFVQNGISLEDEEQTYDINDPIQLIDIIAALSTWLYCDYHAFFKPYYFRHKFNLLTRIADVFGLELPPVPLKRYKQERLYYYFDYCIALADFQTKYELSSAEMCAFLYDFAPRHIRSVDKLDVPLPQPTQVWMIGANKGGGDFDFLDKATVTSTSFWQGNENVHRGDILIMYCLSPRSYIHSIWRATTDGISDPLSHFYGSMYISHCQRVKPVTYHELKADSHFKDQPLVRKNFQGLNDRPLASVDYKHLLQLIASKGATVDELPQLYSYAFSQSDRLKNERDVETQCIEPLLEQLGYESHDWVRQLPIHMGHRERNYPDYVFLTDQTSGYELARMVIESKFAIASNRELEHTFKQVWSYGMRLSASILVIADKDAIWVYEKQENTFDRSVYTKFFWKQLEDPDNFKRLKQLIGKD